jgi:hypothetical protein
VNDRVYELLTEIGSADGEFLCECGDTSCLETIPLTLREYAARRARPQSALLKLSGHH